MGISVRVYRSFTTHHRPIYILFATLVVSAGFRLWKQGHLLPDKPYDAAAARTLSYATTAMWTIYIYIYIYWYRPTGVKKAGPRPIQVNSGQSTKRIRVFKYNFCQFIWFASNILFERERDVSNCFNQFMLVMWIIGVSLTGICMRKGDYNLACDEHHS